MAARVEASIGGEIDEESDERGSMWDLDQQRDQPMDEEAGRLRNMICREKKEVVVGRSIHEVTLKSGMDLDCYVCAAIVDMYAKCGEISDACKLFDGMPKRDLETWTVMIGSYADSGR